MQPMNPQEPTLETTCPICGLVLLPDGTLKPSFGKPMTPSRAQVRVCQYRYKGSYEGDMNDCLNPYTEEVHGPHVPEDSYGELNTNAS